MAFKNLKFLRVATILNVLIAAVGLWLTRDMDYPSQSYSAIFSNVVFYYWMHASIGASFILDFWDSKVRTGKFRWFSMLPPIFGAGVVIWDMHSAPVLHNIATALLMASAVFNLLYHAHSKDERIYAIVLCVVGAIMFPIGMFSEVSLFWTELFAEAAIGIGLARRIYLEDYR